MDVMLVHLMVTPFNKFAGSHLYTLMERETLWEWSVLPKNTTQFPWPGLKPGLLDPEASALTMMPLGLANTSLQNVA